MNNFEDYNQVLYQYIKGWSYFDVKKTEDRRVKECDH
jgi:hypothetical protein